MRRILDQDQLACEQKRIGEQWKRVMGETRRFHPHEMSLKRRQNRPRAREQAFDALERTSETVALTDKLFSNAGIYYRIDPGTKKFLIDIDILDKITPPETLAVLGDGAREKAEIRNACISALGRCKPPCAFGVEVGNLYFIVNPKEFISYIYPTPDSGQPLTALQNKLLETMVHEMLNALLRPESNSLFGSNNTSSVFSGKVTVGDGVVTIKKRGEPSLGFPHPSEFTSGKVREVRRHLQDLGIEITQEKVARDDFKITFKVGEMAPLLKLCDPRLALEARQAAREELTQRLAANDAAYEERRRKGQLRQADRAAANVGNAEAGRS